MPNPEIILKQFVWNDNLETGIDEIDAQHKGLVNLLNVLQEAIHKGDRNVIGDIIKEMADYAVVHFSREEVLMAEAGYAGLEAHKRSHQKFVDTIPEYQRRFEAGEDISIELNDMLVHWLFNHISNEDQGYVSAIHLHISKQKMNSEKRYSKKKKRHWLLRILLPFS